MKFIVPAHKVSEVEDCNYNIVFGVKIGHNWARKDNWSNYYLFDADPEFPLFSAFRYGWVPFAIDDEEFLQINECNVVFFSKSRAKELRDAMRDKIPKRDK